jgi:hypothetical protein
MRFYGWIGAVCWTVGWFLIAWGVINLDRCDKPPSRHRVQHPLDDSCRLHRYELDQPAQDQEYRRLMRKLWG